MNTASKTPAASRTAVQPVTVLVRTVILLLLVLVAFRQELGQIMSRARDFSDWSHAFAMPVVAIFFIWCRKDDIRAALRDGSAWGIVLILGGLAVWFTVVIFAQFGYAKLLGMLTCIAGVVLATAGRRVFLICIPLFLMIWLSLPLRERTVERFSLGIQRISLSAAVMPLKPLTGVNFNVEGTRIVYDSRDRHGDVGLAEQRFGMRLVPACFIVGLFTVFSRRRPGWHVLLLTLASVPIVLLCNVLRIVTWAVVAVYGGFEPTSSVPRNISLATMLLVAYGCFAIGCWVLPKLGNLMERLVMVESDDE